MKSPEYENLLRTLNLHFGKEDKRPNEQDIRRKAELLAPILEFDGDIDTVVKEALQTISHRLGEGISLLLEEASHDPNWVHSRDINWKYSDHYERYLLDSGFPPLVARSLMKVSLKVAGYLQDPMVEGSWDRRGLVIGHVQSGKTANYLGLVARAADAGYKFIVVVAGIHNNLREQTQHRVDEGFVGEISDRVLFERLKAAGKPVHIGVGQYSDHVRPVALTTTTRDFSRHQAESVRGSLRDWSTPVVIVIKKNVSTLKALNSWLKDFNRETGQDQIADVPMLFIDDEADNASVNTNKPNLDPTTTNRLIRETLGLFHKSSYVGYTATPFANIFISPDANYDNETYKDLFPRHFIHCLDAPTNYFGAEKIFLSENGGKRHLRRILDSEDIISFSHKKEEIPAALPPSLRTAIHAFYIARAIRNLRGQNNKHCSMLVNVSRFVSVQNEVGKLIDLEVDRIRDAVDANGGLDESRARTNPVISELEKVFRSEFTGAGVDWRKVLLELNAVVGKIRVSVVNSKSDEALSYAEHASRGEALNVIAIGGLSLSRGLTLEGLTISYMYRNTKMYDTLLQMGRWFGYRPDYEDLCRIWLSDDSINWYAHISESAEELRDSIKQMNRVGASPETFGLRVKSHPDALTITALNKMRSAEKKQVSVSYDGKLVESHILSADPEIHTSNLKLVSDLHRKLKQDFGQNHLSTPTFGRHDVWRDIPVHVSLEFLDQFHFHPSVLQKMTSARDFLEMVSDRFSTIDIGFTSLKDDGRTVDVDGFNMAVQRRTVGRERVSGQLLATAGDEGFHVTSRYRVAGTGDEIMGLSKKEFETAEAHAREEGKTRPTDRHFRRLDVRGRPLMMLHLLDVMSPEAKDCEVRKLISEGPAVGLAFPLTEDFRTIEYMLNEVMARQLEFSFDDHPDLEEDFDLEDRK